VAEVGLSWSVRQGGERKKGGAKKKLVGTERLCRGGGTEVGCRTSTRGRGGSSMRKGLDLSEKDPHRNQGIMRMAQKGNSTSRKKTPHLAREVPAKKKEKKQIGGKKSCLKEVCRKRGEGGGIYYRVGARWGMGQATGKGEDKPPILERGGAVILHLVRLGSGIQGLGKQKHDKIFLGP